MMISMMHTVMTNSVNEILVALHTHLKLIPDDEKLESKELDVTLEPSRPEDAPQLPLFIVDIVLEPTLLGLDPSRQIMRKIFKQILDLWEDDLTAVKSLIGDSIYKPFTKYALPNKK